MGVDAEDKSFLGKLVRLQERMEDGVNRRMDENDRKSQAKLSNNMENMTLQQPRDDASQKSRLSGSSFTQRGDQSTATHTVPEKDEKPPQYEQQPGQSHRPDLGNRAVLGKFVEKPMPAIPFEGGSSSSHDPSPFTTNFASLSLHMTDRIRMLDFPKPMVELVRMVLHQIWRRGIQSERDYYGAWEFKLCGNPWSMHTGTQSVDARRLVNSIFAALYDAGWVLALGTDISRKQTDKDTLIFRHQIPAPAKCDWITVDFARGDRIRILDAPRDLTDAVHQQLKPAIQEIVRPMMSGLWEIKMWGYPWKATGGETMKARRMLLQLVAVLERFGFTVYASVDQESTTSEHTSDADVWHCLRPVGWTPGAPVYHA